MNNHNILALKAEFYNMYNSKIISIRGVCVVSKLDFLTIFNNVLFYYFQFIIAILNNKYMKKLIYFLI